MAKIKSIKKKPTQKKSQAKLPASKQASKKKSYEQAARTRKKNKKLKQLRQERQSVYSSIYRKRQKIKSLKSEEDLDTGRRIVTQISSLQKKLGKINKKLGVRTKQILSEEAREKRIERAQESASSNYNLDPTIYTKWEAQTQFDNQITGDKWKWYIIEGKRMNISNAMDIDFEMDEFISKLTSKDGVLIYYNTESNTIKYEKA